MSTSVSKSVQPGTSTAKKNRKIKNWVTICAAILICIVLGLVIRIQGHVSGSEFAPSHLVRRNFSFYEIPLFHWQITPIRRSDSTPATATYVKTAVLKKKPKGSPNNWHLATLTRGLSETTNADAHLLMAQFDLDDGQGKNSAYWRTWSVNNRQQAAVLWPIIHRLAQRELYILMPRIFATADSGIQTPAELQKIIDQQLADEYLSLITDMREAGESNIAANLLNEALSDYPNHAGLKRLSENN